MLKHCVFVKFRDDTDLKSRARVLAGFGELVDKVDGMLAYDFGPNLDFENKSQDYSDGFIVTFRDRAAHLEYENHPRHQELGKELVSMCKGGYAGILVFDLTVT